jgi:RNA-directed DNA polymerase
MIIKELNTYLSGWIGYYGFAQTPTVVKELAGWIRRRLRALLWTQWGTCKRRHQQLHRLGLPAVEAQRVASSSRGAWCLSKCRPLTSTLTSDYFSRLGLIDLQAV